MRFFSKKPRSIALVTLFILALSFPFSARAIDVAEEAGVAVGLTAGNVLFVPVKVITVFSGLTASVFSFVVTGGNVEISRQIFQNTLQGPYLITPSVARTGVGERPELEKKK